MLKFFSAIAILLIAIFLQLFFASIGWHFNLALAILIAFAFTFEFWELLTLDLLAVFILNWKPAPSVALFVFALVPLAIFIFQGFVRAERWVGISAATVIGFFIFYLAVAPAMFVLSTIMFMADIVVGLLVAESASVLLQ